VSGMGLVFASYFSMLVIWGSVDVVCRLRAVVGCLFLYSGSC